MFLLKEVNTNLTNFDFSRALGSKDLGYESDSNLVIRKREEIPCTPPPPPLSPAEQRQVYVELQKGGEIPFQGLRKPAPEKPRGQPTLPFFSPPFTNTNIILIHVCTLQCTTYTLSVSSSVFFSSLPPINTSFLSWASVGAREINNTFTLLLFELRFGLRRG